MPTVTDRLFRNYQHPMGMLFYPPVASPHSAGTLPKPQDAGLIGIEGIMESFTESEVQHLFRRSVCNVKDNSPSTGPSLNDQADRR
jgi:hypothetical protein